MNFSVTDYQKDVEGIKKEIKKKYSGMFTTVAPIKIKNSN